MLYELTRNVYFVALLHVIGNTWILVADIWSWSGVALVGALVVYFGATFGYRYRMDGTRTLGVHRTDSTVSAVLGRDAEPR